MGIFNSALFNSAVFNAEAVALGPFELRAPGTSRSVMIEDASRCGVQPAQQRAAQRSVGVRGGAAADHRARQTSRGRRA